MFTIPVLILEDHEFSLPGHSLSEEVGGRMRTSLVLSAEISIVMGVPHLLHTGDGEKKVSLLGCKGNIMKHLLW